MLQKEGPMVYKLWSSSCFLIREIMEMFHRSPPDCDKELEKVDLNVRTSWKSLNHLDIGDNVRSAILKVNQDLKDDILCTLCESAKSMAIYMQTHLPLTNSVLKGCHYLCHNARKSAIEKPEEKISLKRGLILGARIQTIQY